MKKNDTKTEIKTCKTCKHWNNKQSALNYWSSTGFCTNDKFRFNTIGGRLIGVLDTNNLRSRNEVTGNCSHDIETLNQYPRKVMESRYRLVTEEKFGCNFHDKEK